MIWNWLYHRLSSLSHTLITLFNKIPCMYWLGIEVSYTYQNEKQRRKGYKETVLTLGNRSHLFNTTPTIREISETIKDLEVPEDSL